MLAPQPASEADASDEVTANLISSQKQVQRMIEEATTENQKNQTRLSSHADQSPHP